MTLPVQLTGDSDCFMLRVQGESMMNIGMYEGDMLIVRHQNTANNGDIVVARIDDEATVKRFYKGKWTYFVYNLKMMILIQLL